MAKLKPGDYKYTIVQHSGFGYGNKPEFARGLETRTLTTDGEVKLVEEAGGVIFVSSSEAEKSAELWMYPENAEGFIPQAIGSFSDKEIDRLKIYVPVRRVVG